MRVGMQQRGAKHWRPFESQAGRRGQWERVSRQRPCPVCSKPDWCLIAHDGSVAICARVESPTSVGNRGAGWLHRLRADDPKPARTQRISIRSEAVAVCDWTGQAAEFAAAASDEAVRILATQLAVSVESLRRLGVGQGARGAWTFPMVDASGRCTGIRLRLPGGRKLSVRGGREGLFTPSDLAGDGPLLLPEGPTDAAALLDLGFDAIGRPSCTGGVRHVVEYVKAHRIQTVVVASDVDANGAGQRGAVALAAAVVAYCRDVRIIAPRTGVKDAREWKRQGATRAIVLAAIEAARPMQLSVKAVRR